MLTCFWLQHERFIVVTSTILSWFAMLNVFHYSTNYAADKLALLDLHGDALKQADENMRYIRNMNHPHYTAVDMGAYTRVHLTAFIGYHQWNILAMMLSSKWMRLWGMFMNRYQFYYITVNIEAYIRTLCRDSKRIHNTLELSTGHLQVMCVSWTKKYVPTRSSAHGVFFSARLIACTQQRLEDGRGAA